MFHVEHELVIFMNEMFMKEAFKEALKSYNKNDTPVGCVIVRNNEIIARAHNCKDVKRNAIMHAELLAVDRACRKIGDWRLNDCSLYTTLEPCMMCMGAILESRISYVYYGAKSKNKQMFDLNKIRLSGVIINYFAVDECSKIMSDFFKNKRKK